MTRPDSTETTHSSETTTEAAVDETVASDQATPSTDKSEEIKEEIPLTLEEQLAAAKTETAAHYDRFVRAVADHENFRKRTAREKDELRQYATSRVLEDLLPVLDNLGLGIAAANQPNAELKTLVDGVSMVQTQLKSTLEQNGLKEINPIGQVFDAHQHEAISQQPDAEVPDGDVITVVRVGYSLNGRLLRPASVIVSSGAPTAESKE